MLISLRGGVDSNRGLGPVSAEASVLLYLNIDKYLLVFCSLKVLIVSLYKLHSREAQQNRYSRLKSVLEQT